MDSRTAVPRDTAPDFTFTDLLRERAAEDFGGVALTVDGGLTLTYGEWDRRADAAANGLLRLGEARLRQVALLFSGLDWADYAVAYHAAQRTGATTVHFNDTMPPEEVARRLEECGVNGIVHDAALRPPAGFTGWTATVAELEAGEPGPPPRGTATDAVADILYTSGTTGPAKAITVTHSNMMYGRARPTIDTLGESEYLLAAMPLGTSSSQGTISLPLLSRSTLLTVLPDSPERTAELIQRYRVGSVMITPATALTLVRARVHERYDLSSVHTVTSASSAFPPAVAAELLSMLPGAQLATAYTSLEASPAVVLNVFDPAKPLSLGRPAHGTRVRIADEQGNSLPTGRVGEIWLHSEAPKRRYLDTALDKRFHIGEWTRMTDLGWLDEDGDLHFFDRAADAIRSDGDLVSSIEVEAVLYEHPAVREAAVIGTPDPARGEAVSAVLVLSSPDELDSVRAFADARLPAAKSPVRYFTTDALPRSFLGKVLKRELRDHYARARVPTQQQRAPEPALTRRTTMPLETELLDVLACPDHPDAVLRHDETDESLTCRECGRTFPVLRGIPVMLPKSARK
ncbi:AMP-binding protein [Streptomyces hygroscopicus]|uniref:AMP-binding protein n=1 Tax=Streptomyces hygroscopicus TaxID=1912 RepID=UPI00076797A6|nr:MULTISPECIES: AMP-binding protein [Streptomyces]MBW8088654.1 AMP-binding protein [Streptomyces hygroscopicus subsp. hygroscopicus]